jgi:Starter unit:ACP transacylase in aflatoxin biosynthesis
MGHCLLLFGPQALTFDEAAFHQLQSVLAQNPTHRWILDTIAELPEWFNTISKVYPAISKDSGRQLLRELNIWLKTGHVTGTPFPLPNILLNPLVTAFQLVQYAKYSSPDTAREVNTQQQTETLGFCTGLLAALAVSSSTSQADLQKYGSVALRLGMLIGMVVDAQETSSPSRSFATKWTSPEIGEETAKIIKSYPEVRSNSVNHEGTLLISV